MFKANFSTHQRICGHFQSIHLCKYICMNPRYSDKQHSHHICDSQLCIRQFLEEMTLHSITLF